MSEKKRNTTDACPKGKQACPIFDDIAQLRIEVDDLRSQVTQDFLTGLYNPRHLNFSLSQEIERTLRSRHPTTLIMVDIDHFKNVNDTYGHSAGDIVLKQVAKILPQCVRKLDVCCRYGGEEFAIILPSTHLLVGAQVAERIRQQIEDSVIQLTEGDIKVTASFGVNSFQYNSQFTQEEFMKSVDAQLYRAKKMGRNTVCSTPQEESSTLSVSSDERAALFGSSDEE